MIKKILALMTIIIMGVGIFLLINSLSNDTELTEILVKFQTKISYGDKSFPDDYKQIEIPENIKGDYDRCYDEIDNVAQSVMICYKVNGFLDVTFSAFPIQYYVEEE